MVLAMSTDARTFIDSLGGYRTVAEKLGRPTSTVHTWCRKGIPSSRFIQLSELAGQVGVDAPPRTAFSFKDDDLTEAAQ